MGTLKSSTRNRMSKSSFAIPSKAPGPGSYPIPDKSHAINALARSSGTPQQATVRRAVTRKFPSLKKG